MKHATKDMAEAAKGILEQQFTPQPQWLKSIEISFDDHGWYTTTRIKSRQDYVSANVKVPTIIDVNGFKLKNCIMILG